MVADRPRAAVEENSLKLSFNTSKSREVGSMGAKRYIVAVFRTEIHPTTGKSGVRRIE
jgi:hypothetical protein